ncbi:MAG: EFR1 family ferrodoxin [Defluviitaleaceae bacterium]|nr:EFR1 family ferrodoxin [Defluviitaleaceae bacterium]
MKKICLYYFSGTGMTKYVVDRLVGEIESHNIFVDCFAIDTTVRPEAMPGYDALIIAYPTHSLNAPRVVASFIARLPKVNGMNTFIVHTCSLARDENLGSSNLIIKRLGKKGYRVLYNKMVEMPSNFVNQDTEKQVIRALANANDAAALIAKDIIELKSHLPERSFGSKIFTGLARIEWLGAIIIGKFFYSKKSCTRCRKCADNCPNKNIVVKKKSIGFKLSCGICMRCMYQCPNNAIDVRRPFKFIRFDKWYDSDMFK